MSYPLTYDDYRNLIAIILAYRPAALFVDVLIREDGIRDGEAEPLMRTLVGAVNLARKGAETAPHAPPYVPIFLPRTEGVRSVPLGVAPTCRHRCEGNDLGLLAPYAEDRPFVMSDGFDDRVSLDRGATILIRSRSPIPARSARPR